MQLMLELWSLEYCMSGSYLSYDFSTESVKLHYVFKN